jgi:hypothetical protein
VIAKDKLGRSTIWILMHALVLAVLLLSPTYAGSFDLGCALGSQCISTQGTKIPADQVIEMMGQCDDFTVNDIGAVVLKLSIQEILRRSNGKPMHPISLANYSFGKLHESPLKFDRKERAEDTKYMEIKRSCIQLSNDFNNRSKWSK